MELKWPMRFEAKDGRAITVRHAAYGDAPALHIGVLEVAQEGVHIGLEPKGVRDLPAAIERVRYYLTVPRAAQLVAELDRQLVGAVSIRPGPFGEKDRHWCSLGVWVVSHGRGFGIGSALVESALAWARSEDFERVILEIFSSNEPAIALFCKFGFIREGRQEKLFVLPGLGYVDKVLMALEIE